MAIDESASLYGSLLIPGVVLLVYTLYGGIYRLFLGPVAAFPGPKLAGLTFWYEFWYDVVRGGQYGEKLRELHEQHGPIIRINPYELHVDDPDCYEQLYVNASERRTDKWWWSVRMFGPLQNTPFTVAHDLHRRRRAVIAPFFTRAAVQRNLQPMVRAQVERLCARLADAATADPTAAAPLALSHAYAALAFDVITAACYPDAFGFLDAPDFAPALHLAFCDGEQAAHMLAQLPVMWTVMAALPAWVTKRLDPATHRLFECHHEVRARVAELVAEHDELHESSVESKDDGDGDGSAQASTVVAQMRSASVPAAEKSIDRITDEVHSFLCAATLTTTHALAVTTYHVLADAAVLAALRAELAAAMPDPATLPPLTTLEAQPYLTAVIYEGLRLANGVPHRLQRVAPDVALRVHGRVVPPGTPVSMSAQHVLSDARVWGEDAGAFRPERWLPLEREGARLLKYFVPFSKGSRACLGMSLAYAEMYLTLAAVVRRFGDRMDVSPTVYERDVKTTVDAFVGLPKDYRRGLRVVISPEKKIQEG